MEKWLLPKAIIFFSYYQLVVEFVGINEITDFFFLGLSFRRKMGQECVLAIGIHLGICINHIRCMCEALGSITGTSVSQ